MKIVKYEPRKISALSRARERFAARKQAQRPAPAPGDTFLEHARCCKTGERYAMVWRRENAQQQFEVREVIRETGAPGQAAQPGDGLCAYPLSAFAYSRCACPYCGTAGGISRCECGMTVCGGGVYVQGGEERCAVYGCCDTGFGGEITKVSGHGASPSRGKRSKISRDDRPRIGHDKKPLLPRRGD